MKSEQFAGRKEPFAAICINGKVAGFAALRAEESNWRFRPFADSHQDARCRVAASALRSFVHRVAFWFSERSQCGTNRALGRTNDQIEFDLYGTSASVGRAQQISIILLPTSHMKESVLMSMKAIVFTQYGSSDRLELKEVRKPSPKDDELLIRVHASSINSWDWEFLNGVPFVNRLMFGLLKPKPAKQILGADIAGTVEAVGSRVTRFQPGDEVFGDLWSNWGGFAEYACAHETAMELKPENSTFEEAAAIPQAGVLALQGLRKSGQMQPGQKVLINGAGGGVGTFAIQLAKLHDAEVTGVDASHKLGVVRSVGADHTIDFAQQDFTRNGKSYDLIIDCQGTRSIREYKRVLRSGGTYAMVGGTRVLPLFFQSFLALFTGESRRFRLVMEGPNKGLADLKELVEAGKLIPVIDRTYQLSEVPEAMRYFGEGRHKGKIAITMESQMFGCSTKRPQG